MADREWLENLASADYGDSQWTLAYPERAKELAQHRLSRAIEDLQKEAVDSVVVFNQHAPRGKEISVVGQSSAPNSRSFLVVMGTCQIAIDTQGAAITATILRRRGFEIDRLPLYKFVPSFDSFGDLRWGTDQYPLCDYETIVKLLLESLCREVLKSGKSGAASRLNR